jgi:6-bladed beta-propeller protein
MILSVRLTSRLLAICAVCTALVTSRDLIAQQSRGALAEWTVDKAPKLMLGEDGSRETQFLRIAGAFRLSANRIAVVNAASNDIRLFDNRGTFVRSFGRSGSGPGEFEFIGWAGRLQDTLFVADHSQQRVSVVAVDKMPRLVRSTRLTARGGRGHFGVQGRVRDGRWLVITSISPGFGGPPNVHRLPMSAGIIRAAGDGEVSWLAERPGLAVFVHNPTGNVKQASVGLAAFTPYLHAVASGRFVWCAESGSDLLERFDVENGERRSIRLPLPQVRPSRTLVAAARAREEALVRGDRGRPWIAAKFSSKNLPEYLPRFEALIPGPSAELWVQRYSGIQSDSAQYLVVDSALTPVAWVRVAAGFRVHEVGVEYVVGVHQDEDGLETVRMYGLKRK